MSCLSEFVPEPVPELRLQLHQGTQALYYRERHPSGDGFAMSSMSAHKGAACVPSPLHGRRTGSSWMDGISSDHGHAAARRLHATRMTSDKHCAHQCRPYIVERQYQQKLWKHGPKTHRDARHTLRVSAMAAMPQLLPVTSTFGVWAALNLAAATGLWSERTRHAPSCMPCACCSPNSASVLGSRSVQSSFDMLHAS